VLGPNGAGKTTTIEMIEGLLPVTSGEIEILGMRWDTDSTSIRNRIGMSLQETKLSEKLSVRETVTLFRSFYRDGLEPQEVIALVDLAPKADSWVKTLSGGQQQRLAVACALVSEPDVLFLDEPTTGLDPQSRRQLWEIIRGYRERGKTVMLTTHYMDEAEKLCDRVAIVDNGQIIALGSPRQLIANLAAEHIIEFSVDRADGRQASCDDFIDLPSVRHARQEDGHVFLDVVEPHNALPTLLLRLKEQGSELTSLTTRHASLEDVFVKLTGRHLDDDEGDNG
jgi:ABC-2 type transport system ATP-binding protein